VVRIPIHGDIVPLEDGPISTGIVHAMPVHLHHLGTIHGSDHIDVHVTSPHIVTIMHHALVQTEPILRWKAAPMFLDVVHGHVLHRATAAPDPVIRGLVVSNALGLVQHARALPRCAMATAPVPSHGEDIANITFEWRFHVNLGIGNGPLPSTTPTAPLVPVIHA
jgi:hypothetical protein